jgi:hypothetical protein
MPDDALVTTIDEILIERIFTPLTGWLHYRFGISQWRLSLECLNGNVAFYIAGLAFTIAGKGMNDGIFVDLLKGLLWLLITDFVRRATYRQASSSLGVQTARMREWFVRLVLTAMLPLSLFYIREWANLCYTLSLLFLIAHLYFKASDTPPPQPRGKLAFARG